MKTKICTKCGIEKPLSEFHNDKKKKDGKSNQCKLCVKEYITLNRETILAKRKEYRLNNKEKDKQYREKNQERIKEYRKKHAGERKIYSKEYRRKYIEKNLARARNHFKENKVCPKCRIDKPASEYVKDNSKKDGLAYMCKLCRSIYEKKHRATHKDNYIKRDRDYHKLNKEKHNTASKEYHRTHLKEQKEYYRTHYKKLLAYNKTGIELLRDNYIKELIVRTGILRCDITEGLIIAKRSQVKLFRAIKGVCP